MRLLLNGRNHTANPIQLQRDFRLYGHPFPALHLAVEEFIDAKAAIRAGDISAYKTSVNESWANRDRQTVRKYIRAADSPNTLCLTLPTEKPPVTSKLTAWRR